MQAEDLKDLVVASLEELKGVELNALDVRESTSITDYMVVVSGTSNRHVKSLADNVALNAKKAGVQALGIEGDDVGEWVLVDLGDVVVHVMLPKIRDFYNLEKLWSEFENLRAKES